MGNFEEQYNDPLRGIELAIVRIYREEDALVDHQTLKAINGLIRVYTAVTRRRNPPTLKLDDLSQKVFDDVQLVCEGWLGNKPIFDETGQMAEAGDRALQLSEVIQCLKRIRRSVEMWQKEGGRRGYFEFIDGFLPE